MYCICSEAAVSYQSGVMLSNRICKEFNQHSRCVMIYSLVDIRTFSKNKIFAKLVEKRISNMHKKSLPNSSTPTDTMHQTETFSKYIQPNMVLQCGALIGACSKQVHHKREDILFLNKHHGL
jgi:hypothetical protein